MDQHHHEDDREETPLYIPESVYDAMDGNGRAEIIRIALCILPQLDKAINCPGCIRYPGEYIVTLSHIIFDTWFDLKSLKLGTRNLRYSRCSEECRGYMHNEVMHEQAHYFIIYLLVRDPAFESYPFLHLRERMDAAFLEEIHGATSCTGRKIAIDELGGDLVRSHKFVVN